MGKVYSVEEIEQLLASRATPFKHNDIIRQLLERVKELENQDARQVWEASPNCDFSGRKCAECGFDNRFHAETCLFQSPDLRITKEAFDAAFDRAQRMKDALIDRVRTLLSGAQIGSLRDIIIRELEKPVDLESKK